MEMHRGDLPEFLRPCFWDVDFDNFRIEGYEAFVIERVLEYGDTRAFQWLRENFPPELIAEVLLSSRSLPRSTVTLWAMALGISPEELQL